MLASLAPARRRLIIVLAAVVAVFTAVIVGLAVGRDGSAARPVSQSEPGPILLVPGYGGTVSALRSLQAKLQGSGREVQIVTLPGNAEGDLTAQARVLGDSARAVLARTGARSVDVVGYSAGGVVARLWVRDEGGSALARRVVTLGSPQHGTQLATVGSLVPGACPMACQQLAVGSPLLSALNSPDRVPDGPEWVSVWTSHDDVVLPPDSGVLAGARNLSVQSLCPSDSVSHSELPRDAVVQRIVLAALGTDLTLPPRGC